MAFVGDEGMERGDTILWRCESVVISGGASNGSRLRRTPMGSSARVSARASSLWRARTIVEVVDNCARQSR